MSTGFVDLLADAKAALEQAPPVSALVRAGRLTAMPASAPDGVFLRLARANGDQPFVGVDITDWDTDVIVTCAVRAASGVDGHTAVDPLLEAVWQRLTALVSSGTDSWTLLPDINFDVEEADQTLGAAELRLRVRHRTAAGVLTAAT